MRIRRVVASPVSSLVEFGVEHQRQLQHAFVAAAEECEGAVRGDVAQRLGEKSPSRELGAFVLLDLLGDDRLHDAVLVEVKPQRAQQSGILGELFHEDLAGAVEHCLGVGKAGFGVEATSASPSGPHQGRSLRASASGADAGLADNLGLGRWRL